MKNTKALVVVGSRTNENCYGITSGVRVSDALEKFGWHVQTVHAADGKNVLRLMLDTCPDLVVPVGFGAPCEDGHIFAAARLAGIPCSGPTPAAGSLMQDKAALSRVVDAIFETGCGVRSPNGVVLTANQTFDEVMVLIKDLTPLLVVKPNFSGSSEGLSVVTTRQEAASIAIELASFEGKVLIQEMEKSVIHEISCTTLDRRCGPQFLPIVELRRDDVLVLSSNEKFGARGFGRHIVPAPLEINLTNRIKNAVLSLHKAVGSVGLTRTDILVLSNGELVILEVNGIPGLLESSIACDAAKEAGITFHELAVLYAQSAYLDRMEPNIWEIRRSSDSNQGYNEMQTKVMQCSQTH